MDYQQEYIDKNPDLHTADSLNKVDSIYQLLSPINLKFTSIIDVACGSGQILLEIADKFRTERAVGIDISKKMIEVAESNDTENHVDWVVKDVYKLGPENFELVLAVDILEHIQDDLSFLKHIKNLGQFIVVKTPVEDNIINRVVKFITFGLIDEHNYTESQYGHIHHYSEKEIDQLIKRAGLVTISKKHVHLPKRSKIFWEVLRVLLFPFWFISKPFYLKLNGGFLVLLLTSNHE